MTAATTTGLAHPLDPLTPTEIERTARLILDEGGVGTRPRFAWIALDEPSKGELADPAAPPRRARALVVDRDSAAVHDVVVDLDADAVESVRPRPGRHAPILFEEWIDAARVLDDERVIDALARRGVHDRSVVEVEPWPAGYQDAELDRSGRRLARCVFFVRAADGDTDWARPVDQLVVIADRGTGEVLALEEGEVLAVPDDPGRLDPAANGTRGDLRALHITQPNGPSFELHGRELTWQRWRMRIGVHPIDGLVLHQVGYDDPVTGNTRSILHRASLAEMAVPYGDPSPTNRWRHVFDAGEVGMGKNAASLTLGCDCLGEIRYLDAHMAEPDGRSTTIANAVCIHEEDDGVLWRHLDWKTGETHVRRSRRLVVSSWANLGNYDYGFFWNFYQDGSIQVEVKLTGVPLAMSAPDPATPHCDPVAAGLVGPVHQHLFCFRLDLDIDGPDNTVTEIDVASEATSDANPYGNAFAPVTTPLTSELSARRSVDTAASRRWRVTNPTVSNAHGQPVGYDLIPTSPCPPVLADPGSWTGRRLAFARHHLWVTPHRADELHPAGDLPNQSPVDDGLVAWTAADRPISDTDVVCWFTCGSTHIVRPEDWPVMPVDKIGFHLKPAGFFDRNPAMDVPVQDAIADQGGHCSV